MIVSKTGTGGAAREGQTVSAKSNLVFEPNDWDVVPSIKRTKFKLPGAAARDVLLAQVDPGAFDERLSILVKQGKVRSGVYTGIGQEAIIVGTGFGLRKEDYICPLHAISDRS